MRISAIISCPPQKKDEPDTMGIAFKGFNNGRNPKR
jgi:hypothetical protein